MPFICRKDTIKYYSNFIPHWHENIEILHCIDGEGSIIINGFAYDFKPNTVVVLNPNEIHTVTSQGHVHYDCIIIFDEFCKENGIYTDTKVFNSVIESAEICMLHKKMCDSFRESEKPNPVKIRLYALELLFNLCENFSYETFQSTETGFDDMKSAIDYINRNYQRKITLDEIAEQSNLSKYYFTKKFKETTGKTFNEFLNGVRCKKAKEILKCGKSVNEACFSSGFNDPAYFSRVFKKIIGIPPSHIEYKK